jgi:hypothetical protein
MVRLWPNAVGAVGILGSPTPRRAIAKIKGRALFITTSLA